MSLPHVVIRTDQHGARVPPFNAEQVQAAARIVDHEFVDHPGESQLVAMRSLQTERA